MKTRRRIQGAVKRWNFALSPDFMIQALAWLDGESGTREKSSEQETNKYNPPPS
jgi:hypothetical protein